MGAQIILLCYLFLISLLPPAQGSKCGAQESRKFELVIALFNANTVVLRSINQAGGPSIEMFLLSFLKSEHASVQLLQILHALEWYPAINQGLQILKLKEDTQSEKQKALWQTHETELRQFSLGTSYAPSSSY